MEYKRVRGWTLGRSLPILNFVKYPLPPGGGGWGTPYNGLYGEVPPERRNAFQTGAKIYLSEKNILGLGAL